MTRPWRRTQVTAAAVLGALVLTATLGVDRSGAAPAAPAQTAFNKGTGSALAESIRIDPVAGGLSFGIGIGQALAGHQNTAATAESRGINLGVIGVTLAGEGCDGGDPTLPADQQPQTVRADSGAEGADAGFSEDESFAAGQIRKQARATTDPLAEAVTTSAPFDIPGVVSVSGARSTARSGIIDGNLREAIAIAEIDQINFAGVVTIGGYRAEAIHRSGAVDEVLGGFSFGNATIGGVPIPVDDPVTALAQLNAALLPLGYEIRPPLFHTAQTSSGTIAVVDPLAVAIVPSPTRDSITGAILNDPNVQDTRTSLFDALLEIDCGNSTYITIVDIALSALGPGGYLALEFGGVSATTGAIAGFQFGTRPPTPTANVPVDNGGGSSTLSPVRPGTPAAPVAPGGATTPTSAPRTTDLDPTPVAQNLLGERGGLMAGVAGGGLLALLASAEGDRRKMRRAQRAIPLEA